MTEAGRCFSEAVSLDPGFGAAHSEVGQQLLYSAVLGLVSPREAGARGRLEVERALELDESLGEAHATLVRLEQAELEASEALELDPLCPESHFVMALVLFFRREYERAENSIRTTLELGGANPFVQWLRGVMAALQGRFEEAIANCEGAVRLYGRAPMLSACLGMIYGFAGKAGEARAVLTEIEQAPAAMYASPIYRAWVYLGLGEIEQSLEWLDRAIDFRDPNILHLPVKPVYDRLRGDCRFARLLRKMRLPETPAP
jgi:adenylate cyclase